MFKIFFYCHDDDDDDVGRMTMLLGVEGPYNKLGDSTGHRGNLTIIPKA